MTPLHLDASDWPLMLRVVAQDLALEEADLERTLRDWPYGPGMNRAHVEAAARRDIETKRRRVRMLTRMHAMRQQAERGE